GIDSAIERGRAYQAAGADALFIEAPTSIDELRAIGRSFGVPLLANMVEGGRTPLVPAAELEAMGFKLVLHAGALLRTAALAIEETLRYLRKNGSTAGIEDRLLTFEGRNRVTDLEGA